MPINMKNLKEWVTIISEISKDIKNMNAGLEPLGHQDLKVTTTTLKSIGIEHLNVDPNLYGHQTNH